MLASSFSDREAAEVNAMMICCVLNASLSGEKAKAVVHGTRYSVASVIASAPRIESIIEIHAL